jgi:hypothetical protein
MVRGRSLPRRGYTYSAWGFNPRNPPPPKALKGRQGTRPTPRYFAFQNPNNVVAMYALRGMPITLFYTFYANRSGALSGRGATWVYSRG